MIFNEWFDGFLMIKVWELFLAFGFTEIYLITRGSG